jgi:hypothetical protein
MPIKIIKMYRGTNIFKGRAAGGRIKYGYRWTHEGRKYTRARWDTKEAAELAFPIRGNTYLLGISPAISLASSSPTANEGAHRRPVAGLPSPSLCRRWLSSQKSENTT